MELQNPMLQQPGNLFEVVQQLSLNDSARLLLLLAEARRQALYDEGDFIELGVYRGGSALLLAYALQEQGSQGHLHLLDAWQGMPPPAPEDAGTFVAQGALSDASEQGVRTALAQFGLLDRASTYGGWFEQTLPPLQGPFALAHVDCDFYEPMKFCLTHLLPRMSRRGNIVVDDYGSGAAANFPGVERAVNEVLAGTAWRIMPLGGARDRSVLLLRKDDPDEQLLLI